MKILQLIHKPQNRGAETFTCQLTHNLIQLGHDVKIVAVYNGKAQLPYSPNIETLYGSETKKLIDIAAWRKLDYIIKRFRPEIIQANSGDTLKYAVFSKIIFRWNPPIVSRNASEVGRYLRSSLQKSLNKLLYRKIDLVISVSQASKNDIISHFPFLAKKSQVIPVGLEKKVNVQNVELNPLRSKHIVHVGGFSFEKNHRGLISIFTKVMSKNSNIHLHLIGDGILRSEIEELVKKGQLQEKVKFYGFVNNPMDYINAADVLVLPSVIEGLPGVLLEAMYCKTPVVAYNVGGISEIVTLQTGKLIEKNDEAIFVKSVLETLENPNGNQIENAYQMVVKDYMNEEIAKRFVEVYKAVIR